MSKYVDVEWLIKESMPLSFSVQKWVNEVQIMTAPSIDIVFCKECKWDKAQMIPKSVKCIHQHNSDDFCSYGERREDLNDEMRAL